VYILALSDISWQRFWWFSYKSTDQILCSKRKSRPKFVIIWTS